MANTNTEASSENIARQAITQPTEHGSLQLDYIKSMAPGAAAEPRAASQAGTEQTLAAHGFPMPTIDGAHPANTKESPRPGENHPTKESPKPIDNTSTKESPRPTENTSTKESPKPTENTPAKESPKPTIKYYDASKPVQENSQSGLANLGTEISNIWNDISSFGMKAGSGQDGMAEGGMVQVYNSDGSFRGIGNTYDGKNIFVNGN